MGWNCLTAFYDSHVWIYLVYACLSLIWEDAMICVSDSLSYSFHLPENAALKHGASYVVLKLLELNIRLL
jgi:hypothetical protein